MKPALPNLSLTLTVVLSLAAPVCWMGCSHRETADPVNPARPYTFPGTPPAPAPASQPAPGAAPAAPTTPGGFPGLPSAGETSSLLRAGDMVTISFSDIPLPGLQPVNVQLGNDGKITLPFNVIVNAVGKTCRQLEQEIRAEYVPKYYKYLTVTAKTELRYYHVGGEVKLPHQIEYRGEVTVLRAIEAAGGFTDFAKKSKVRLRRVGGEELIVDWEKAARDSRKDPPVYPGDYIYVPRRLW
jgi:polysaccharide export outer membrane protein